MTDAFDPYHKWLGISPKDQPPDHYRLLGIDRFESDLDVIASAADQRMAHVRSYQLGEHSDLSQKLLNEIAAAKVCLLNPEKKEEYDRQLRQRLEPVVPKPVPMAQPLPAAVPTPSQPRPAIQPEPQSGFPSFNPLEHLKRKGQSWQVLAAVGAAAVALALIVTLIAVTGTSPGTGEEETARTSPATEPPTEHESLPPPPEEAQPAEEPETDPFEHVPTQPSTKDGGNEPKEPISAEESPEPTPVEDPAEPKPEPPKTETVEEAAQRLREQYDGSETEADFKNVAEALLVVADRAIVAGNDDLAKELLTLALTASRHTNDTELKKTVVLRIVGLQKPLEEVQKAAGERLKKAGISVEGSSLPDVSP